MNIGVYFGTFPPGFGRETSLWSELGNSSLLLFLV